MQASGVHGFSYHFKFYAIGPYIAVQSLQLENPQIYWIHATFSPPIWNHPQYPLPEWPPLSEHTWDQGSTKVHNILDCKPPLPTWFLLRTWTSSAWQLQSKTQLEKTWSQEQDSLQEVQLIILFPSWQLSLFLILCNRAIHCCSRASFFFFSFFSFFFIINKDLLISKKETPKYTWSI